MPGFQRRLGRQTDGVKIGVNDVIGSIEGFGGIDSATNGIYSAGLTSGTNGTHAIDDSKSHLDLELDVLVIGAGFAGCYLVSLLRKTGFSVKIVEAGSELGGIWYGPVTSPRWTCHCLLRY